MKKLGLIFSVLCSLPLIAGDYVSRQVEFAHIRFDNALSLMAEYKKQESVSHVDREKFLQDSLMSKRSKRASVKTMLGRLARMTWKNKYGNRRDLQEIVMQIRDLHDFVIRCNNSVQVMDKLDKIEAFYAGIDDNSESCVGYIAEKYKKYGNFYRFIKNLEFDLLHITCLFNKSHLEQDVVEKLCALKDKLTVVKNKIVVTRQYAAAKNKALFLKSLKWVSISVFTVANCAFIGMSYALFVFMPVSSGCGVWPTGLLAGNLALILNTQEVKDHNKKKRYLKQISLG